MIQQIDEYSSSSEVFHVYENIKCEKCGKVIAEPKELIEFWKKHQS